MPVTDATGVTGVGGMHACVITAVHSCGDVCMPVTGATGVAGIGGMHACVITAEANTRANHSYHRPCLPVAAHIQCIHTPTTLLNQQEHMGDTVSSCGSPPPRRRGTRGSGSVCAHKGQPHQLPQALPTSACTHTMNPHPHHTDTAAGAHGRHCQQL